jgi:glycine cleavage system H protein
MGPNWNKQSQQQQMRRQRELQRQQQERARQRQEQRRREQGVWDWQQKRKQRAKESLLDAARGFTNTKPEPDADLLKLLKEPRKPLGVAGAIIVPQNLWYTDQHVWLRVDGGVGTVGITSFRTRMLSGIRRVVLPEIGRQVAAGEIVSEIQASIKISKNVIPVLIPAPVSGEIMTVNGPLTGGLIHIPGSFDIVKARCILQDPYGKGWLFRIRLSQAKSELQGLMDRDAYQRFIKGNPANI